MTAGPRHFHLNREMTPVYVCLRERARDILSRLPQPPFYTEQAAANALSRQLLATDPVAVDLQAYVATQLEDDFGHGVAHAVKVALDAGALMLIEGGRAGYSPSLVRRRVLVVQSAGLLHDIRRKTVNHAEAGADFAAGALQAYPFSGKEVNDICLAIRNHEAFRPQLAIESPAGHLVSDCLYDADKFRWGPDNFSDTLWQMVSFMNPPLSVFVTRYPSGMEKITKIKSTFRSRTGKRYGPQFIDLGLAVGRELYEVIMSDFSHLI
jgi:hypothetical protein